MQYVQTLTLTLTQHGEHVQYVQTPPNSVFNIHCFRSTGMYQVPGDAAWVVHHLKRPQGMGYLWRRLHDRAPHDANACLTVRGTVVDLTHGHRHRPLTRP